jgi:tetratricopeptide (TPR) repeat protein
MNALRRNARRLSGVFFVSLLSACATTPQTTALLSLSNEDVAPQKELASTPFFPQEAYQCGPAALATMLVAQQREVSPEELVDKVYIPEKKGSLQIEMIATARQFELITYPIDKDFTQLIRELESGRPVLVFQNLAFNWAPQWHYAVVVGYDLANQTLTLRSGASKRHQIKLSTFERTWARGGYWAYVFAEPGQIPVTAEPFPYLKAAESLAQSGFTESALISYQAATQHWPDSTLAYVMLGNTQYETKQYAAAQASYENAIQLAPQDANSWNNYAYSLLARGCQAEAQLAIRKAIKLAPNNPNIAESAEEIATASTSGNQQCHSMAIPKQIIYE